MVLEIKILDITDDAKDGFKAMFYQRRRTSVVLLA